MNRLDTPLDAFVATREKVLALWAMVAMDMRWETRASFAVMLTKILLNMSAIEAGQQQEVVLWLLNGEPSAEPSALLEAPTPAADGEADSDETEALFVAGTARRVCIFSCILSCILQSGLRGV